MIPSQNLPPSQRYRHLWPEADQLEAKRNQSTSSDWLQSNPLLLSSLESSVAARSLIESEQSRLAVLIDQATNEVERDARSYQFDLVGWQLTRAADVAEKRLAHFTQLRDFEVENAKCASDIHYWFDYYAWGFDPRPDAPLAVMPFAPFDFQKRFISYLDNLVFTLRSSGTADKARDMGATVTALGWGVHHWRYRDHFTLLLASAKEELTDKIGDSDTIFERLRFIVRMLPSWMLPKGFNLLRDLPYMKLSNEQNGSLITGSAPTTSLGEGRRRTAVLMDEFADWPEGGYPQYTTLTQTSKSLIAISTPKGRFNKYADLMHDGVTPGFAMDWREHPWKDGRWYNSLRFGILCPAMTTEDIAQEVDRNYDASQPGRVLKNVREEYCFITEDELVAAFPGRESLFYDRDGQFRLPTDWNWGRVCDYGESAQKEDDTHIWAYSLFARPAERWPRWSVDSLFFLCSLPIMPIGASEIEGYAFYSELERSLGLRVGRDFTRSPQVNDMSHEATDPKEVLLTKCGDYWSLPDLDFNKGRRKLVFHFEIVDKHLPNPVRSELTGRARIYFVAPKGSYFMARNDRSGSYFVTPSETQRAFKRLRKEIPSWHYPPEERGKPVPKMRPKSVFDDIITTVRYAVARWGVDAEPLRYHEKVEEVMQPKHREILATVNEGKGITPEQELSLLFAIERAKRIVDDSDMTQEYDEYGDRVG